MHRYKTSTPRITIGIGALAMTAITIGALVVTPAEMEAISYEPGIPATSAVSTLASTGAVTRASISVLAVDEPELASAPCKAPDQTANEAIE